MADRLKVLLVEPDKATSFAIATALRAEGWDVLSASDAIQTLSVALKEKPDALVVSSKLPGGGGLGVLKRLRSVVHTAVTPAIALIEPGEKDAMLAAGAQECIQRPADPAAVCNAVRRHSGQPMPAPISPPVQVIEAPERLAALRNTGLVDKPTPKVFDQLTWLAAKLLNVPTATVSLVGKDRQMFRSPVGLPPALDQSRETPLSHSFCQWVVGGSEEVVVADARQHPVLKSNLAVRDYNVIAYAGVPLSTDPGLTVGAFCAIDSQTRTWTEEEMATLRSLAHIAEVCIAATSRNGSQTRPGGEAAAMKHASSISSGIQALVNVSRRWQERLDKAGRDVLLNVLESLSNDLSRLTTAAGV